MPASKSFADAFFRQQSLPAASEWQKQQPHLFLEEGSSSAFIEAYAINQTWNLSGMTSRSPAQLTSRIEISSEELPRPEDATCKSNLQKNPPIGESLALTFLRTKEEISNFTDRPSQSQVFFIRQRNSYSPLSLTSELYGSLVSGRHVSPLFRTFLQYLGERDSEVEIVPSAPRLRLVDRGLDGRLLKCFELMCGIRFIELHGRADKSKLAGRWSFRQSAIYMRGGGSVELPTCLLVTPSKALQARLDSYLPECAAIDITSIFEIQAMVLDSAIANWRQYIVDLTAETDVHAAQVLGASPDDSGPMNMSNSGERQSLMILDEKVQNSLSAVKHTRTLLTTIIQTYETACGKWAELADDDIMTIYVGMVQESDILTLRLQALKTRLEGVVNLVSSFLELNSGFALQQLALESRRENEAMRQLSERMHLLTEKSTRDAVAVKILTIMTMIYLPATVVSNFFSTSFVITEENQRIAVLSDWWIFFATSVPLTMLTLYIWWVWVRIQARRIYPWWWFMRKKRQGNERPRLDEENLGSRFKQS